MNSRFSIQKLTIDIKIVRVSARGHVCMYVCYSLEKWLILQLEQERTRQAWSILRQETQHSKNEEDKSKVTEANLKGVC